MYRKLGCSFWSMACWKPTWFLCSLGRSPDRTGPRWPREKGAMELLNYGDTLYIYIYRYCKHIYIYIYTYVVYMCIDIFHIIRVVLGVVHYFLMTVLVRGKPWATGHETTSGIPKKPQRKKPAYTVHTAAACHRGLGALGPGFVSCELAQCDAQNDTSIPGSTQLNLLIPSFPLQATVDGQNPAPPKKPRENDCPVNTNKQWFPVVSKWCRISSTHSITERIPSDTCGAEPSMPCRAVGCRQGQHVSSRLIQMPH